MAENNEHEQALARTQGQAMALPTPVFTGAQMGQALAQYRELQNALDRSMPDQVITLQGKPFRKKGYWRAVNVAFNLNVELVEERREIDGQFEDGRDNFGYVVTYRATASNGRTVTGDGACFAVDKAPDFRCPHPQLKNPNRAIHFPPENCPSYDPDSRWRRRPKNATEHNVRSHAHTRAYNRAISNCVGFGEVSAEEMNMDGTVSDAPVVESQPVPHSDAPHPAEMTNELPPENRPAPPPEDHPSRQQQTTRPAQAGGHPGASNRPAPAGAPAGGNAVISQAQSRRFFALAMSAGWDADDLKMALRSRWGYDRDDDIPKAQYNRICAWVQLGPKGAADEAKSVGR